MSEAPIMALPVRTLIDRGVSIHCPYSVEVDESVNSQRIAPGVIIHTGCRIAGAETSIGPGSELGAEAPVTIDNCQLGHNVELKGGFFSGATFLDGAVMGSAAHVRPGTLIEEEAAGGHAVGFKQTIFLSYVTAGSLINFCDALMAGGTDRKNHSEIGSSYVHFNYTPHQDKATPSLIGDVPRGVFLDQPPIFLGGQGGLVGPTRIAYGTVIAAGTICRRDILEEQTLYSTRPAAGMQRVFTGGAYRDINRIVKNNLIYIGNLWALKVWYQSVRKRTMSADIYRRACFEGALARIEEVLIERGKRMKELSEKMPLSLERAQTATDEDMPSEIKMQQALVDHWPEMEPRLQTGPDESMGAAAREVFSREWEKTDAALGHCKAVGALSSEGRSAGAAWLQGIVDSVSSLWKST